MLGRKLLSGPSLTPKEFGSFEKGLPSGELQNPSRRSADLVNAGQQRMGMGTEKVSKQVVKEKPRTPAASSSGTSSLVCSPHLVCSP